MTDKIMKLCEYRDGDGYPFARSLLNRIEYVDSRDETQCFMEKFSYPVGDLLKPMNHLKGMIELALVFGRGGEFKSFNTRAWFTPGYCEFTNDVPPELNRAAIKEWANDRVDKLDKFGLQVWQSGGYYKISDNRLFLISRPYSTLANDHCTVSSHIKLVRL